VGGGLEMKHLNHRGSGFLLVLLVGLVLLMLSPVLGISHEWKANTTPYRLLHTPSITWPLIFVLAVGMVWIRFGNEFVQCVSALIFTGMVIGLGLVSAWYWDSWLPSWLLYAVFPIGWSSLRALRALACRERTQDRTKNVCCRSAPER
jgi:hypothetical protein